MEKLHSFSPTELGTILCGEQAPVWTREDILNYTEPKLGYTKDRYVFLLYINILSMMFLHFSAIYIADNTLKVW